MFCFSTSAFANSTCKILTDDANAAISWSGNCDNGIADGIGELVYRPAKPIKTFGFVSKGNITGLHLAEELGFGFAHVIYFSENGEAQLIGPMYESKSKSLPQFQQWQNFNGKKDSSNKKPTMTYEEVLNSIKSFMAQKSDMSIDFPTFKAHLEGGAMVTGGDDSPVKGVSLSLGGNKSANKKSKKRN